MTTTDNAIIRVSGLEITAPTELVICAGWTVDSIGVATDNSSNGFVERRLYRTLSERGEFPQGKVSRESALHILARCVELAEIESLERKRDNSKLEVAKLELEAARHRKTAAEIELTSRSR